jgi:hypothetical protein
MQVNVDRVVGLGVPIIKIKVNLIYNRLVTQKISLILKSEALLLLGISVWVYSTTDESWWMFFTLLLLPDLFMLGYLKNSKTGALIYNIGHTYTLPLLVLIIFLISQISILLPIAIIWIAHISMDRLFGYGLKLDSDFKDTHLGRL